MNMETKKIVAIVICCVMIIGAGIAMFVYKDVMFRNKVVVTYPDGCEEVYYNTVLSTPLCERGRQMEEEQAFPQAPGNNAPKVNFSFPTITP